MSNKSLYSNKRVAQNTLYLYFRTLIVMAISIYTSRVVLDVLGVENYGIYNVVGGFVSLFSVLSGTLTAATQRFLSFELGKDTPDIRKVFSTALNIHVILAVVVFLLLETGGIWFMNTQMNISPDRMTAANWVFQCSIATFCINIVSIPYNATIIAYEKMSAFAYISIFEVSAKLLSIYLLYIVTFDPLIAYALFMFSIAVVIRFIYGWYCKRTFKECRYSFVLDKVVFRDMISFNGWNFIGSTASVMNGHGINLLMNIFFGVTVNAAKGIATQVDSAINSFVQNFMMALNPQITKSYAAGDYSTVNKIILLGSKFSFFMFLIICLPFFLNIEYILSIWLKQVPEYTAVFVRCAIIFSLCQSLSQCLYSTMLATGKIKQYQIVVGTLSLMAFPLSYIFFKMGFSAVFGYIAIIICSLLCLVARLWMLQNMLPDFSAMVYIHKVIYPIICSTIPIACIIWPIGLFIHNISFVIFIFESLLCCAVCICVVLFIGITKNEREHILDIINRRLNIHRKSHA